ncbi:MAG: ATPase domain-containing protein [Candidatus Nitrosotenuis sp.]
MIEIVSTGNEEIDVNLGGGLPIPSLMLIEGEHGTGKSAVAAQFIKGMLNVDMKLLCITENTVSDYIKKMKTITFNFSEAFLKNDLTLLSLHVNGSNWSKQQALQLLPLINKYVKEQSEKFDCVVIDSLSFITTYSDMNNVLDFVTSCKYLVSSGMSVILTMHPNSIPQEVGLRLKAACDVYFSLKSSRIGDQAVKIMTNVKMIGSSSPPEASFAFSVDPVFGIKIIPISMSAV